jgi:outer membrane protein assembly factor BamB
VRTPHWESYEQFRKETSMIWSSRGACLALMFALPAMGSAGDDWPNLYGPLGNGVSTASGVFASIESVGVEERWRRALGSGYASMIAVGKRAYTTHSEGESDYAAGLDLVTGKTIWKTRLGNRHVSGNAADDGVLASPAVSGEDLYTVTAKGELFALGTASGEVRWKVDLVETLGAKLPFYGFTASPLIDGPRLIVQVGGETENNLVAFARTSGELLWTTHHADGHTYASPTLMELDGERHVVALAGNRLIGVDGPTGRLLWSIDSPETEPDRLLPVPGGRIFLPLYQKGGWMVTVERDGDAWTARELWLQPSVKRSHGTPVHFDGAIYAFQGSILLCLDVQSGEVLWRERVYDGSLIVVDGRLVLLSRRSGLLHVIEPSREGYRELMREQVFEAGKRSITPPTFADGALLLRNLEEAVALSFRELAGSASAVSADGSGGDGVLWRLQLEDGLAPSGRSRVSVAGDALFTLAADAEAEHALAVSAVDGRLLWRRPLDPLFEGATSGAKGDVIVAGERLLAVTTACNVHALSIDSGESLWRADLLGDLGGGAGSRGCETTPAVDGDLVVVHAAGEESRRVIALDLATGELVWSNDEIERPLYTSPRMATVDGVRQVLVHTWSTDGEGRSRLQGLRLADGVLLWSHDITEDWSWREPLDLGDGRFLVSGWNRATVLRAGRQGEEWRIERLWQEDQLASPVLLGDEICGSRRGGISCVSVETGEERRRLETGTVRLELRGDTLAALSYDSGVVRLLDTSGSGLEEWSEVAVFSAGAVNDTSPTFDGARLILRNHEELVAVRLE